MGCCFSRPDGPNSPYPGDPNTASARAINTSSQGAPVSSTPPDTAAGAAAAAATVAACPGVPAPAVRTSSAPSPPANAIPVQSRRRSRRDNQPLDQHINKPLRRHVWTSTDRTWTRRALDHERIDFFDTRVTGRQEVWQTLHAALRVLWDPAGQGAADDGTDGVATAQGFLDATEVTLPTGDLAQGAYDSLGNYYPLPEWVVADPDNMASDGEEGEGEGQTTAVDSKGDLSGAEDDTEIVDDDEAERKREEKGKGVIDVKEQISVHARLSDNTHDVTVSVGKGDAVRHLARCVHEESGLPDAKMVRLAYMGKILKENVSLPDQGWKPGHVVNALVFNR